LINKYTANQNGKKRRYDTKYESDLKRSLRKYGINISREEKKKKKKKRKKRRTR
jgi:hypothetical protein